MQGGTSYSAALPAGINVGNWIRLQLRINFSAANGNGTASLFYKHLSQTNAEFVSCGPAVTNVDINLPAMGAIGKNPATWNGLYLRQIGAHLLDNVKVGANGIVYNFDPLDHRAASNGLVGQDGWQFVEAPLEALPGTIYFPHGTYLVSDTVLAGIAGDNGLQSYKDRHLQGQSQAGTIIKLKNNSPGFSDIAKPKAVVSFCDRDGGSNQAFTNYLNDMTIRVGSGNPGAIGVRMIASNQGGMRNVTIESLTDPVSGQRNGDSGLNLRAPANGPALFKNINVIGFNRGIWCQGDAYGLTLEHVAVKNQLIAGIEVREQIVSIRGFYSDNTVHALRQTAGDPNGQKVGLVTLIDATCVGGTEGTAAVWNSGGLYARNLRSSGYSWTLDSRSYQKAQEQIAGTVSEFVSHETVRSQFATGTTSLHLPVKETPEIRYPDLDKWFNVENYGATGDGSARSLGSDDTLAVQAAFNAAAQSPVPSVVYFPFGSYNLSSTIHVSGNVKVIHGFYSRFRVSGALASGDYLPAFSINNVSNDNVCVEQMYFWFDTSNRFTAWQRNTTRPTVFRNVMLNNKRGISTLTAGEIYLEDVVSILGTIPANTFVWGRQVNPESAPGTNLNSALVNDGGTLWILGLKNESQYGTTSVLSTKNGGQSEILGCYILVWGNTPPVGLPAFENIDAQMSLVYVQASNVRGAYYYKPQIKNTEGGQTEELNRDQLATREHGVLVPLYIGY